MFGVHIFIWSDFAVIAMRCIFATPSWSRVMSRYIECPWWSLVVCRLNWGGPHLMVVYIGMDHLSMIPLLLIYLSRLTNIIKHSGGCKIWFDSICQMFFLHRKQDFCIFLLSLQSHFLHENDNITWKTRHSAGPRREETKFIYNVDNIFLNKWN